MAYWIDPNAENKQNCRSYYCDYTTDIDLLPRYGIKGAEQENDTVAPMPCNYGSECVCLEDATVWILGKDTNEWKQL